MVLWCLIRRQLSMKISNIVTHDTRRQAHLSRHHYLLSFSKIKASSTHFEMASLQLYHRRETSPGMSLKSGIRWLMHQLRWIRKPLEDILADLFHGLHILTISAG